jgi:coproporphyrinogen III oxidase-like Fe-S oxidoreductase
MTGPRPPAAPDAALFESVADRFAPQYDITGLLTNAHRGHAEEDLDAAAIREAWRRHVRDDRRKSCRCELSAYIHIPFCRRKCAYCCYYSVPLERPLWLSRYLDVLAAQLEYFAPAFSGRRFEALYIGGGTPSLLSARQLRGLLSPLFKRYSFHDEGERAFEFNPVSVSADKLAVLEEFGFNRVSMGVQSFRPEVLRRENRGYQTYEAVARAMRRILARGRFILNVDLLVGLRGDDGKAFLGTLDALLALEPSTVTAYPVKPTVPYLAAHYGGDMGRFEADLRRRYGEVGAEAAAVAGRRGYVLRPERPGLRDNNWLFRRQPLRGLKYVYDDIAPQPVSVFSVGPTARSCIAGELAYQQEGTHDEAFSPQAKVWKGRRLSPRWEMKKFALRGLMDHGAVSGERFRALFGTGLAGAFPAAARALGAPAGKGGSVLADRTPRQVFLAALRFLDPGELEGMAEVRFALSSAKGSWRLSLRRLAAGERSMSRAGSLGLILRGEPVPLVSPRVDGPLLKLVSAAFLRAAGRERSGSSLRVASLLLAQVRAVLARLERGGRIPRRALRLTQEGAA